MTCGNAFQLRGLNCTDTAITHKRFFKIFAQVLLIICKSCPLFYVHICPLICLTACSVLPLLCPRPHRAEALRTCLTSCLSRTSGLSREQRGLGRLKLTQEVAHFIRTPLPRSKGQRSTCRGILWRPPAQLVFLVVR